MFSRRTKHRRYIEMQDVEFLEYVVKQLVANPNDVKVERTVDERGVLLTLSVNPADLGYVIGKKGQTITSLRTLIRIVGAKSNSRTTVKVNEPEGSHRRSASAEATVDTSVLEGDIQL